MGVRSSSCFPKGLEYVVTGGVVGVDSTLDIFSSENLLSSHVSGTSPADARLPTFLLWERPGLFVVNEHGQSTGNDSSTSK